MSQKVKQERFLKYLWLLHTPKKLIWCYILRPGSRSGSAVLSMTRQHSDDLHELDESFGPCLLWERGIHLTHVFLIVLDIYSYSTLHLCYAEDISPDFHYITKCSIFGAFSVWCAHFPKVITKPIGRWITVALNSSALNSCWLNMHRNETHLADCNGRFCKNLK
jgi:hypothetical protein